MGSPETTETALPGAVPKETAADTGQHIQIPAELQALEGWLVWRFVDDQPGRKPRKVPHYAKTGTRRRGEQGGPADRAQLVTFAEAVESARRGSFDGVGLAMLPDWGIVALDFDDCVRAGRVHEDVEALVAGTYAELSPSGNGVRAFMRGALANKKSLATSTQFGFEVFHSTGFVTVTGRALDSCALLGCEDTISNLTPEALDLYERRFGLSHVSATPRSAQPSYDINRLHKLLAVIPARSAANYDDWLHVGMALHHETAGQDSGLALWDKWSAQAPNYQSREDLENRWRGFGRQEGRIVTGATIERLAGTAGVALDFEDVGGAPSAEQPLHVFYAYLPMHQYIHRSTRAFWPAASVDGHFRVKIDTLKASQWLDQYRAVQQATWHPGYDETIKDMVVAEGGFVPKAGMLVYNRYRAPTITPGNSRGADLWRDHLRRIYPAEADHIEQWLAQRIQRPAEKINHALVLGGAQGIGKDSILEPVRRGVGSWNWRDIEPKRLVGNFNPWVEAVVLRINEARDLGDTDRFAFYDHSKTYIAAPPDVLTCNDKHAKEYPVFNVMGVILTTNHKTNGIYLPMDDRRHFVAWSDSIKEDFTEKYWREFWAWLDGGGDADVTAYLRELDLRAFNPKAPPPKTEAFFAIVQANANPDDVVLAGVLMDANGNRLPAVTIDSVVSAAIVAGEHALALALQDTKNRRRIPHMMERAGYAPLRNPDAKDGLWKIGGKRQVVYADSTLSMADRFEHARRLGAGGR